MQTFPLFMGLALANAMAAQSFAITITSPGFVVAAPALPTPLLIGPLANFGQVQAAGTPTTGATIGWGTTGGDFYAYATANGDGTASSAADTGDWLIQATGPGPGTTHVALEISCNFTNPAFGKVEHVEIDVGDDGSIECDESTPFNVVGMDLGTTPIPIRLHIKAKTPAAPAQVNVSMRFVPPMQTQVQRVLTGCATPALQVSMSPGNDWLGAYLPSPSSSSPRALVIGFSAQPQLLQPNPLCGLLIPHPDFVMLAVGSSWSISIPTPAAVRPFSLWLQSVTFGPTALVTSDAYFVLGQP